MDSPEDLLTTAEVAQIMRSPVSTLRYWRHLGTGPHSFRLGRRVVYRRADVTAWLLEQSEAGRAERAGRAARVIAALASCQGKRRRRPGQRSNARAASALTTWRPK